MPCNRPMEAVRVTLPGNPVFTHESGKPRLLWGKFAEEAMQRHGERCELTTLPCGKCFACRCRYVSTWATRCELEMVSRSDTRACFLTLTYAPQFLPANGSLDRLAWRGFMKRLREFCQRVEGITGLKYLMCGEYGERTERPHYHAVLIGFDFAEWREPVALHEGRQIYTSKKLNDLWGMGVCDLEDASPGAARYVAGYTMKKLRGGAGVEAYEGTGREPPYILASDGLGLAWLKAHWREIYPVGQLVSPTTRRPVAVPRYFDLWVQEHAPEVWEETRRVRQEVLDEQPPEANDVFARERREEVASTTWKQNRRIREPESVRSARREGVGVPRAVPAQDSGGGATDLPVGGEGGSPGVQVPS